MPPLPYQTFADQLTLSQSEGADYAHHITTASPRIFRISFRAFLEMYAGTAASSVDVRAKVWKLGKLQKTCQVVAVLKFVKETMFKTFLHIHTFVWPLSLNIFPIFVFYQNQQFLSICLI